MAVIVSRETVCDVGREKCAKDDLKTYRITSEGESRTVTLCRKHRGPIDQIWDHGVTRGSKPRVFTMEEIQEQKRRR